MRTDQPTTTLEQKARVSDADERLLNEGRELALGILRANAPKERRRLLEGMLVLIADGFPVPKGKRASLARMPGKRWRVGVWERFEGMVGDRYILIPPDEAMVSIFVPSGGCSYGVGPELLIPPFDASKVPPRGGRAFLWSIYNMDPCESDPGSAEIVRALRRGVRAEALLELSMPEQRRSELDILYDVGRGREIDRILQNSLLPADSMEDALINELEKVVLDG